MNFDAAMEELLDFDKTPSNEFTVIIKSTCMDEMVIMKVRSDSIHFMIECLPCCVTGNSMWTIIRKSNVLKIIHTPMVSNDHNKKYPVFHVAFEIFKTFKYSTHIKLDTVDVNTNKDSIYNYVAITVGVEDGELGETHAIFYLVNVDENKFLDMDDFKKIVSRHSELYNALPSIKSLDGKEDKFHPSVCVVNHTTTGHYRNASIVKMAGKHNMVWNNEVISVNMINGFKLPKDTSMSKVELMGMIFKRYFNNPVMFTC